MRIFNTTKQWSSWWKKRKVDWEKDYQSSWNHPHRYMITSILSSFHWTSLIEVGFGGGANLINIVKHLKGKQLGGVDIVPEAVEAGKKAFRDGVFKVSAADDILMSDNSTDVVLSDMVLIYVGPLKINKYIKELKRIARNYVIFCEFHHPSLWQRLKLKVASGYNAHDYEKLLTKHGFYDIVIHKIPNNAWPKENGEPSSDEENQFRYIIKAKKPKYG